MALLSWDYWELEAVAAASQERRRAWEHRDAVRDADVSVESKRRTTHSSTYIELHRMARAMRHRSAIVPIPAVAGVSAIAHSVPSQRKGDFRVRGSESDVPAVILGRSTVWNDSCFQY